jgi:hypothetical protein
MLSFPDPARDRSIYASTYISVTGFRVIPDVRGPALHQMNPLSLWEALGWGCREKKHHLLFLKKPSKTADFSKP